MRDFFVFFRHGGGTDPALEREFRSVYQEPSLRYLQLAFVLGAIGFGGFLVMDLFHQRAPALPGVSLARGVIVLAFASAWLVTRFRREFVVRHYTPIVNFFIAFGMLGAALLPMAVHGNRSNADIYWSLNSSLTTGAIVSYGFSRLTARNTALIVLLCTFIDIGTAFLVPAFDWYPFGRLVFHLSFVNIAAFSLRETVERRERQLFLLARENLSKNIYAKELESAKALAEQGNEVKLRFLANMSHEFRTPMNAMMQTLEIAGRTATSELGGLIDGARRSGYALLAMLNSILEYTRWTQPGLRPSPTPVSISEVIRQVVQRHEKAAADRGLHFVVRLDLVSSKDVVRVDRLMLEEVVTRLLDNAIRYTPSGRISVGIELTPRRDSPFPTALLQVSIADTGIGIAKGQRQAIYNPFVQLNDASNRKVGGTGLGLAIVRRLVEVMSGSIALESEVGVGSTFRVAFPVEICKSFAVSKGASSARSRGHRLASQNLPLQGTVLLAEDNELNAQLAAELLGLMGLDVTLAADGAEALRAATQQRFDVILMDCQMPNMDGYEATRRIRQEERAAAKALVPIVAVTANALAGEREKCLATGMDDYLAKPYTAAQLRSKLVEWLPVPPDRVDPASAPDSNARVIEG